MEAKGNAQPVYTEQALKIWTKLITVNVRLNMEETMFAWPFLHIRTNGEIAFNAEFGGKRMKYDGLAERTQSKSIMILIYMNPGNLTRNLDSSHLFQGD